MSQPRIHWISNDDPPQAFPDVSEACTEPDGLLAAGGDLSSERLLYAYQRGIFPWYSEGQVVLWWSPDPRCVLVPAEFHLSRRLRREIRNSEYQLSFNQAFDDVVAHCATSRQSQEGTWITGDMARAYNKLHQTGWAHSIEIWHGAELAGGLYGLAIGRMFFGESMFSRKSHASKIAMLALSRLLVEHDFSMLDCQVVPPHLLTLGASLISRPAFQVILQAACDPPVRFDKWPSQRISITSLV